MTCCDAPTVTSHAPTVTYAMVQELQAFRSNLKPRAALQSATQEGTGVGCEVLYENMMQNGSGSPGQAFTTTAAGLTTCTKRLKLRWQGKLPGH
jgi:hypothetical protein